MTEDIRPFGRVHQTQNKNMNSQPKGRNGHQPSGRNHHNMTENIYPRGRDHQARERNLNNQPSNLLVTYGCTVVTLK